MAIRQTTSKWKPGPDAFPYELELYRTGKAPEVTKEEAAANREKWFKKNQAHWGFVPDDSPLRQQTEWPAPIPTRRRGRYNIDVDERRARRARVAATGEPLVRSELLPAHYKGQLTITAGGCWTWNGGRSDKRHGHIYQKLFATFRGPKDPAKLLHHLCENGSCVNPWHIEQMTTDDHKREHAALKFLLLAGGVGRGVGRRDVAY